jgi:hypothetical protein
MLEHLALARRGDAVEDHPTRIGQQHRVPGAGKLLMQIVHFGAGDVQHLLQALAAFQQAIVLQHRGGNGQCRVEVIVLQAAQPGTGNRGIAAGTVQRVLPTGDRQDLPGMAAEMIVLHLLIVLLLRGTHRGPGRPASSTPWRIAIPGRPMGHRLYRRWHKLSPRLSQSCHSNALQQTLRP